MRNNLEYNNYNEFNLNLETDNALKIAEVYGGVVAVEYPNLQKQSRISAAENSKKEEASSAENSGTSTTALGALAAASTLLVTTVVLPVVLMFAGVLLHQNISWDSYSYAIEYECADGESFLATLQGDSLKLESTDRKSVV